jgi:hypothetical protein
LPGIVARIFFLRRAPCRPRSRISRSVVHRATAMPCRFSSSHALSAPQTSWFSFRTRTISVLRRASRTARADGGRDFAA